MIEHLCAVAVDCQSGVFSGEDKIIAELTGKPPMTVADDRTGLRGIAPRGVHDGER
jgi:NAD(P)H dehydrogenase (quinone)